MIKRSKWLLAPLVIAVAVSIGALYIHTAYAAQSQADCDAEKSQKFLGVLPKWYEYLPTAPDALGHCTVNIKSSCVDQNNTPVDCSAKGAKGDPTAISVQPYWLIGLAAIDILARLAGFVAVIFVIYGGIRYITSSGEPENTKAARETIINALIGLIIVLIAVPAVAYIGSSLGTTDINGVPQSNVSIQDLFNTAYRIIGAIAVLMIVIAGFKYIISNGDPQSMGRAKDTILYTLIGALVVLVATGIIDFVVTKF